jgi:Ni/Co efflux regulator RcnB
MKRIVISALALSMLAGAAGSAAAQPYGPDRHDDRGGYGDHRDGDHRGDYRSDRGGDHRGDHWGDHGDWRRGGRIDRDDWRRGDVVDYRMHHLRRPPRGYEWREIDGRYVLAAVATGVIADIILNGR